jgi:hypothetical protein
VIYDAKGDTACYYPAGTGTQGQACYFSNDCETGFECIDWGQAVYCSQYCRVGFSDCPGGATCYGFLMKAYDLTQEIGVCR